jgi:hypothetical protein
MQDHDRPAVRVVCDYNADGELIALGYSMWVDGALGALGWRPVGPFDTPHDLYVWVELHVGFQLRLDLS